MGVRRQTGNQGVLTRAHWPRNAMRATHDALPQRRRGSQWAVRQHRQDNGVALGQQDSSSESTGQRRGGVSPAAGQHFGTVFSSFSLTLGSG